MPTTAQIKEFFVRGRKVILPDNTKGTFMEFKKTQATVARSSLSDDGPLISVPKGELVRKNLREW